jgi:hypothetical protein
MVGNVIGGRGPVWHRKVNMKDCNRGQQCRTGGVPTVAGEMNWMNRSGIEDEGIEPKAWQRP